MNWVTLPAWFWITYYLFILMIFCSAIYSIIRKKLFISSIIALIFTITVPIISLINSIERPADQTEFDHLLLQLQQGAIWSIYTLVGYAYLLFWFVFFLLKKSDLNKRTSPER